MADKTQKDKHSTPPAPEPVVDIPGVHLDVLRRTGQPVEWWCLLGMAAAELGLLADLVVKREIVDWLGQLTWTVQSGALRRA